MRILWLFVIALPIFAKELFLVSILPQKYVIDSIVKERFTTEVLLPKGASPVTYTLKPSELHKIQSASRYFTIGVPFERAWLPKFKELNPKLHLIDMGRYCRRFSMTHHHHDEHEDHQRLDPHIWLAPTYLIAMARVVLQEAIAIDPDHASQFLANYRIFAQNMAKLDEELYSQLLGKRRAFMVFHPSFGYFARFYDLTQIAIEEEGKEPKMRHLLKIAKIAQTLHITTILIEPQFPKKSAQFLAKKIGAKVVIVDPLAYDIPATLEEVARVIGD